MQYKKIIWQYRSLAFKFILIPTNYNFRDLNIKIVDGVATLL